MKKNNIITLFTSIVIIYALLGFFLLPSILHSQLEKQLNSQLNATSIIEKISFNPFLFKLELLGLTLAQKEKVLVRLEKIAVDVSIIKSIEELHIHLKTLLISKPTINLNIDEKGTLNLASLVKEQPKEKQQPKAETQSNPIGFEIDKTILEEAAINTTILKNGNPTKLTINNLNYIFYDLGTYKNRLASHKLDMKINTNTQLTINGGIQLDPIKVYGNIAIKNLELNDYLPLAKKHINFYTSDAKAHINFGFQLKYEKALELKINNGDFLLENLHLSQQKNGITGLASLHIKDINLLYPQQTIGIDSIELTDFYANAISNKKGVLNLSTLVKESSSKETVKVDKKQDLDTKKWIIDINSVNLNEGNFSFNELKNNQKLQINNTTTNLENLLIDGNAISLKRLELGINQLKLLDKKDKINLSKASINLENTTYKNEIIEVKNILAKLNKINVNSISASTKVNGKNLWANLQNVHYDKEKTTLKKAIIKQPNTIVKNKDAIINTQKINVIINDIVSQNSSLFVKSSSVINPKIYITLLKNSDPKVKQKIIHNKPVREYVEKKKLKLNLGPLDIKNARLQFEDKNLPIPFKTDITKLNGQFTSFISDSLKPTKLTIEGAVDKYGYSKITGLLDHENVKNLTDVNMIFKNIAIKNFTPYSGKFVGREIDSGKLNLDLKYNIKKSDLKAENSIIISDIKLGQKIDSPDATSLPLELAIALMEDSNGIIDLNIPISGNVDDPKFSIAPIVWKAFSNLIVKAITSPFSFLASLLGLDEEKLKSVEFPFGESQLLSSEKESLDAIAKAMTKRPKLSLKVLNAYNSKLDKLQLQTKKFEIYVEEAIKKIKNKENSYFVVIEEDYKKRFPKDDLKKLQKAYLEKVKGKTVLDKERYLNALKNKIIPMQEVTTLELETLAKERFGTIQEYLVKSHKIEAKRVFEKESLTILNDSKAKWAPTNFEITVNK